MKARGGSPRRPREVLIRGKGLMDGCSTLGEAIQAVRTFAEMLEQYERMGYQLQGAITDDYAHLER